MEYVALWLDHSQALTLRRGITSIRAMYRAVYTALRIKEVWD